MAETILPAAAVALKTANLVQRVAKNLDSDGGKKGRKKNESKNAKLCRLFAKCCPCCGSARGINKNKNKNANMGEEETDGGIENDRRNVSVTIACCSSSAKDDNYEANTFDKRDYIRQSNSDKNRPVFAYLPPARGASFDTAV